MPEFGLRVFQQPTGMLTTYAHKPGATA
jgi:hypothetical protein